MKPGLQPGAVYEFSLTVTPEMNARLSNGISDEVIHDALYGTAPMVMHMEWAARQHIKPYLEPGEESVGHHVDIRHLAPTPVGGTVRMRATVVEVTKRTVTTHLQAWNERPESTEDPVLVGEGHVIQAAVPLSLLHARAGFSTEETPLPDAPVVLQDNHGNAFTFEMQGWETPFPCTRYDEWMVCRIVLRRPGQPDFDYKGAFLLLYEVGEWLKGLQQVLSGEQEAYASNFLEPLFAVRIEPAADNDIRLTLRLSPSATPGSGLSQPAQGETFDVPFTLSREAADTVCRQLQAHLNEFPSSL